ncbi:MAG: glycosyltransferase [Solirubrobacterales bacterium]
MKTWVVTPVYRDVTCFETLRERLLAVAQSTGARRPLRFVVVDDTAGEDPEIEVLRRHEDVTVLRPPFNLGHQRALVYGLRKTLPEVGDDDLVVTLDADGEDRPEDLPRLLAPLEEADARPRVVLALRTRRRESLGFKAMYLLFRLLFRILTGTTVRTGNFAVMPGALAKRVLVHPTFDLAYSSALLSLDVPLEFVPCERGIRYVGKSKMTFGKLSMHGLRMLMPFTDRIAGRALLVFVASFAIGLSLLAAVVGVKLFSGSAVPGWAALVGVCSLIVSLVALGNFVSLFVLFSQTRAVSLANLEDSA